MYLSSSIRAHSLTPTTSPISTFPITKHHLKTRTINPLFFSTRSLITLKHLQATPTPNTTPIMSPSEEVARDFSPFLKIYKDGHIERLVGIDFVPPSLDPKTGVESRDVTISSETGLSARLYLPPKTDTNHNQKLPLIIYFHGGGFCVETPFCEKYNSAVTSLVAESNVVAISVDYRLAPENPVPIPYEDSWAAVLWAAAHAGGAGSDEWLNSRADFSRVYLAGDSAGANIAHNLAVRAGKDFMGLSLAGVVLVHPYFWGKEPVGAEPVEPERRAMAEGIWRFAYPNSQDGTDDVLMNPAKDPSLGKFGAVRVLVCVAEKDGLRERGWFYKECLEKSGWVGTVEMLEAEGDDHVFHLSDPTCGNAVALVKKIASFVNH